MQGSIRIIMSGCTREDRHLPVNEMPELHYNFVFFFARDDYWQSILGKELYECDNVHVYEEAFEGNRFLKKLFHYHWSYRVNRKVRLPFKRMWFRKMYEQSFPSDLPLCFVYLGGNNIRFDGGFCEYVKKQSSLNRQVILHQDLISKKLDYDYNLIKNRIDLCVTYDKAEAEKYGIHYFQETTFSKLIPEPEKVEFEQDVYFLGAAKDRLPKILSVYQRLHNAGLKCKFLIAGVPEEQQVPGDGLIYTKGIPYIENLNNVIHSKCVLELIQGDSVDITTRALEAIAYRRKLLTDCQICDPNIFNNGQLQIFQTLESIDLAFLQEDYQPEDYEPRVDLNPMKRLYDIQNELEKQR